MSSLIHLGIVVKNMMSQTRSWRLHIRFVVPALLGSTILFLAFSAGGAARNPASSIEVATLFTTPLQNLPGQSLTVQKVSYGPGASSPGHTHAGSVFAYVLSGSIRSENSATGPARVFQAGECFFEPPLSKHSVSENASRTQSASLLAIFVAPQGADLTTPTKAYSSAKESQR